MRESCLKYKSSKVYLPTKWHFFIFSLEHKGLFLFFFFFRWLCVHLCVRVCEQLIAIYVCVHLTLVNFYWLFNFLHARTAVKTNIRPKYPKYWPFSVMISACQTTLIKSYHNDLYWKMNIKRNTHFAGNLPIVFSLQIRFLTTSKRYLWI